MRPALTLFTLAALAGCMVDRPQADTATTPPAKAAPDSTDEWFVSEYGFRIPLKGKAEFLKCAGGITPVESRIMGAGPVVSIAKKCLPDEAYPPEGLKFCGRPGSPISPGGGSGSRLGTMVYNPELHYCREAGAPTLVLTPSDRPRLPPGRRIKSINSR